MVRAGFSLGISVSGPLCSACLIFRIQKRCMVSRGNSYCDNRQVARYVLSRQLLRFSCFLSPFAGGKTRPDHDPCSIEGLCRRLSLLTSDEERRHGTSTCHEDRYFGCLSFANSSNIMWWEHIGIAGMITDGLQRNGICRGCWGFLFKPAIFNEQ